MTSLAATVGRVTGGFTGRMDRLSDGRFATIAFLPGAIMVGAIVIPPIIAVLAMSLFRIELVKDTNTPFVAFDNFARMARDDDFVASVPRTIVLAAGLTAISVPLALGTALLLNRRFRGSSLLGVAVLLPWAIAPVVTGVFWAFIFQSHYGIITGLAMATGITNEPVRWLRDPSLAMVVAVLATAWRSMPVFALILLAALKSIPEGLYRAARMDGASPWQSFRYVTLPGIRNTLLVVIILAIITSLSIFDILFTLTKGGPGRETTVIPYYIYLRAFQNLSFGYSAALAVFLLGLIILFSSFAIVLRLRDRSSAPPDRADDEDLGPSASAGARIRSAHVGSAARAVSEQASRRDLPAASSASPAVSPLPGAISPRPTEDSWDDAPRSRRRGIPGWLTRPMRVGLTILLFAWLLLPILWILIVSVQPERAVTVAPPNLTLNLDFGWYSYLLSHPKWIGSLAVSLQVTLATMLLTVAIGALAAYPLARLQVPFRSAFMGVLVFTQMVPAIVMAIPVLLLFNMLRLRDSVAGLILINVAFLLPLVIWLLRGYFEDVPRSIESAARIDGCSRLGTLFRITMPAAAPGISAIAILILIGTWNEFLFAIVLGDKNAVTVTRRITDLGSLNSQFGVDSTQFASAGILAVLPPLILVLLFHRRIVRGLTEGFVKG